jgi:hypothetical protein
VPPRANIHFPDLQLSLFSSILHRLVKAEPYIAMDYVQFDLISDMMAYIDRALSGEQSSMSDIGFIEGFGYGPDDYLVAQGRFVDEEDALSGAYGKVQKYSKWWSPWFYKRARRRRGGADVIPTEDYLFRHDRGSFWMASYKMPHIVGRAMGWALPSAKMYKLASMLPAVFDKSEILLQDFMIPVDNVESFVDSLDVNLGVWPLWFCPLKNLRTKGLIFGVPANGGHFCNVGAYGIPEKVRLGCLRSKSKECNMMSDLVFLCLHHQIALNPKPGKLNVQAMNCVAGKI